MGGGMKQQHTTNKQTTTITSTKESNYHNTRSPKDFSELLEIEKVTHLQIASYARSSETSLWVSANYNVFVVVVQYCCCSFFLSSFLLLLEISVCGSRFVGRNNSHRNDKNTNIILQRGENSVTSLRLHKSQAGTSCFFADSEGK